MTVKKTERLMNLMVLLLVSRRYRTKSEIRESLEGYQHLGDAAFEKTFERDKEELRQLGIPLEIRKLDYFAASDMAYGIPRDAFELPVIDFAPDELAVIGVAARAWTNNELGFTATTAVNKLRAAGMDVDLNSLDDLQPVVQAEEAAFVDVWRATGSRTKVSFDYQPPGSAVQERTIQPWRMFSVSGRWYVVGMDSLRKGPRIFRLSRIQGEVRVKGKPGAYELPPSEEIESAARQLTPQEPDEVASVLALDNSGNGLRRRSKAIEYSVREDQHGTWDRLELPYASVDALIADLLAYGDRVILESPPQARAQLINALDSILIEAPA